MYYSVLFCNLLLGLCPWLSLFKNIKNKNKNKLTLLQDQDYQSLLFLAPEYQNQKDGINN